MPPEGRPIWSASPDEVRERFLAFFRERGHEEVPSAPLVPENDPTLLFTGAGMNPFKDHFLGRIPLKFRRATTAQKCLRTGDLENVGRTPGHHTFFEMLGNFSFGDYFKEEAIAWAWEFLTEEMGIPRELLRVSVYEDDDEAAGIWSKVAGIPPERVARLGAKSNFWPANAPEDGPDGPCGPCSEIFFDLGEGISFGPCTVEGCPEVPESVDCDCRRFIEVWNLVFQQYERKGRNHLVPLASKNIDTGMGFERLMMVLAHLADGSPSKPARERIVWNFQTRLFEPLLDLAWMGVDPWLRGIRERLAGTVEAVRRVADHARAAVFCVAEGIRPGNEKRSYILRRIIRRATRDLWNLRSPPIRRSHEPGEPYLYTYAEPVAALMGTRYPGVADHFLAIADVILTEEQLYAQTYEQEVRPFFELLDTMKRRGQLVLPGTDAFRFHDERGLTIDVIQDILASNEMSVDLEGFDREMAKARKRSRAGSKIATNIFYGGPLERLKRESEGTVFLGYGPEPEREDGSYEWDPGVEADSTVAEILVGEKPEDRMEPGQEGAVVLRETPFYAEQGGQVGDAGEIRGPGGAVFRVKDTKRVEAFHVHLGVLEGAPLDRGAKVRAVVDRERRDAVRRNHTATHLLHKVLRETLGEEATQAGSLVAPDYLRFDYAYPRGLTAEERERIEGEVNRRAFGNHAVRTRVLPFEEARATGAVHMFGEKYGARVRVLDAADSREFCGGTHCRSTGDIGSFRILSEKSIGSGVRRIEAVTGERAVREFQEERRRLRGLEQEVERLKKEVAKASRRGVAAAPSAVVDPLAAPRRESGGIRFVLVGADGTPEAALLAAGDRVKEDGGAPLAALLHAASGDGVSLVAVGNRAALEAGFKAGDAVRAAAKALGGGGGGRADLARGKGPDPSLLPAAVEAFEEYLRGLAD